ncbi:MULTISPECIES: hypothetical protein [Streptomyces]|uniref:hypothetical protein n=1 Tax=Streptomyces TaxID=1883 RepID=UPI0004B6A724|nr:MULTISPECIES: hypothetical protein [unclassified Streptomyces]MYY19346.1 hypothetical protein [Streptomyces sp. SID4912]SCE25840.1 hypothetical protein GA0115241_111714 [Streptomyces sp. DpondAA-D4]
MTNDESVAEDPELEFWTTVRDANTRLVREDGYVWRPNASFSRSDLDLPPVANGLDYLVNVVDLLGPDDEGDEPAPRKLKYAILHLDAAAEVLLKARLEIAHWSLVVGRIEKGTTYAKYKAGDFQSVGTEEALRRLRQMVEVDIPAEGDNSLTALGKLRNQLQHYGLVATRETIEPVAAQVLDFLIAFLDDRLLPTLRPVDQARAENDMLHVRHGLNRIQGYVDTRMSRLAGELAGLEDRTVQCTRCFQDALVAGDGEAPATVRCRFCRTAFTPEDISAEYASVHRTWIGQPRDHGPCGHCGSAETVTCRVVRVSDIRAAPEGSHVYGHVNFCFACARPASDDHPDPSPEPS